jgi:hypothetical protein
MKTRLTSLITTIIVVSLLLAACSSAASVTSTASTGLSQTTELVMGTIKLEGTGQAPTTEQAGELLTLWQAYQSLANSDSTAQAELDGLVDQIQENMTSDQMQAIADMQLSSQSQAELIGSLGTEVISDSSHSASQASTAGQQAAGGAPPDGGAAMPMDDAAMQTGDQVMPQAASQASTGTNPQQVSPLLINALIEALSAQAQTAS